MFTKVTFLNSSRVFRVSCTVFEILFPQVDVDDILFAGLYLLVHLQPSISVLMVFLTHKMYMMSTMVLNGILDIALYLVTE